MLLGVSIVFVLVGAAGFVWWWNLQPWVIRVEAAQLDVPGDGFSHNGFEELLVRFVDARGYVAYEKWLANDEAVAALDAYLATVAAISPENAPDRFRTRADRLSYWLNVYNASVIKAVLVNWPLESVTDVTAPIEVVTGLGFFAKQRFVVGGKEYSLYDLERSKIRDEFEDPRVHFVLNCASGSCPILRPELPQGSALEEYLTHAAREFVGEERNVRIDHGARRVVLSNIFAMYEKEFVNDLRRRGVPGGVLAYVQSVAPADLRSQLDEASDYTVEYDEFDWSLNAQ